MPRNTNPGSIKTGAGKTAPVTTDSLVLTGMTPPGAPPNFGKTGYKLPGMTLANARHGLPMPGVEGAGGVLGSDQAHVNDPVAAHMASAIGLDPTAELFATNVQGAVNELAATVAPRPPMLGQSFSHMTFSGIPDWGTAKLRDESTPTNGSTSYPYYWTAPTPTSDWGVTGNDPQTDTIWNSMTSPSAPVVGSGKGAAKAGAFTTGLLINSNIRRTRGIALQKDGVQAYPLPITVSGTIFPADRGVLALVHWPKENTVADFLLQPLLDRCVAALLLGAGTGTTGTGNCITKDMVPPATCDGASGIGPGSGSIFSVGVNADGYYDPFSYPGQATGQYDLKEIHTGLADIDSSDLPTPWDGAPGWVRTSATTAAGPGQVRLGTDPTADTTLDPITMPPYGIPVLGAGLTGYSPVPATTVTLNDLVVHKRIGSSLIETSNFFRYRLPYLKDYSQATGLKYTPHGLDVSGTRDTARYFMAAAPHGVDANRLTDTGYLVQAGNYDDFDEDCWTWQVARYRHSFYVPGSDTAGVNLGSYWMVHFKTEANFEAFVRDGIMPWDATKAYEVYGVSLVDTVADNVAGSKNLVNSLTTAPSAGWDPGTGPAPGYGFGSRSYHVLRSNMVTSDNLTLPTAATNKFTWTLNVPHVVMFCSGVAYFVPVNNAGAWSFKIAAIDLVANAAWEDFYRVDDNGLTGDSPPIAPARLSSACPVFIGVAQFAYEATPTYAIGGTPFGDLAAREKRIEIPFNYTKNAGGVAFSATNGPLVADVLKIDDVGTGITFLGDVETPAFTTDAVMTTFIRRPLAVVPIQPVNVINGNGIPMTPQTTGPVNIGAKVLFHSTGWNAAVPANGQYGNFPLVVGACDANLTTPTKDVEERFLDEIYRYKVLALGTAVDEALFGPGMAGWNFGPILIPVRAGNTATTWVPPVGADIDWRDRSFFQSGNHLVTLSTDELQVAGLPYRNPAFDGSVALPKPMPSAGLLLYPKENYSAGFVPDDTVAGGGLAVPQVDYSTAAFPRSYVRAFDAAFARNPNLHVDVVGQPFVTFRIDGIGLADFAYAAPGPGNPTSGISVKVKVPGLTTWMDLGRVDGDGPSKQDPALDGAGCKVLGPYTFDNVDSTTGMIYCQVRVNVGPGANLAPGQASGVADRYEAPVLVKVTMADIPAVKNYDLTQVYVSPGGFGGVVMPGAAPADVRGLCGIKVVNPSLLETAPTA